MTSRTDWDPEQYAKFQALRSRPFWDLAALIDARSSVELMFDLGCGSGELTVELADHLDVSKVVGVDSSPAMLARSALVQTDRVTFHCGDITSWTGTDIDLVIANASLQWVPDHHAVLARWIGSLRPGGQIAVQVPANADHPSHLCSAAVALREPFLSAFSERGDVAPPPDPVAANVLRPEQYSELLHDLGVIDPHVRLQVYPQVMPSSTHVVEWVSGTSLTRFFKLLPDELHQPFVDAFTTELLATIGDHAPYFYAFKRILMWGHIAS